jgi:hypothetical protein
MRRMASYVLVAALAAVLGHGGSANAAVWCAGQIDYNCNYTASNGKTRLCTVWLNWKCADPQATITISPEHPLGTCDGVADAMCDDHGVNCTIWLASAYGCVIGL